MAMPRGLFLSILGYQSALRRQARRLSSALIADLLMIACFGSCIPEAQAAAPGLSPQAPATATTSAPPIPGQGGYVQRDPTWVAKKEAFQISSGLRSNGGTTPAGETQISPHAGCCGGGGAPASYELPTNNQVPGTWEPSNGCNPNYGPYTSEQDDNGADYCKYFTGFNREQNKDITYEGEKDFNNLCGPGAATIALRYWPNANTSMVRNTARDTVTLSPAIATEWSSERMRAYMTYLAWQINWPSGGLSHPGMMDNTDFPSYGTTLYGMVDALNWEESGHTTLNGFYISPVVHRADPEQPS